MRNLRTEQEIMANWKGDLSKPVVSVCCIAYNHELYIEDALEGFLIQETDFPFEIIIHDDASTDKTADIIREYSSAYPNIIKPIFQTENQFSMNFHLPFINTFNTSCGEYIALCEGDDYWISSEKLQKQVELMRQYPDINISFHPAYKVDGFELVKNKIFANHSKTVKIFPPKEVILGDGGFMPTQSLMIKSEVMKNLPDWFFNYAPVGDYYIQIISSIDKGALYLPFVNSIYRTNIAGSWSTSQKEKIKKIRWLSAQYETFNIIDPFYEKKYASEFRGIFKKYLRFIALDGQFTVKEKYNLFYEFKYFPLRDWSLYFYPLMPIYLLRKISVLFFR
ncbi:MAG: glycosyltransferase family 2 protein [Campylobacterales bacterium]|nr:glycosyltransferase family 2 protein [Campylobacterales bacterium]